MAESLCTAARQGDIQRVTELISQGADVNGDGRRRFTPLIEALRGGHTDVAKLLVKQGADVNLCSLLGLAPLITACYMDGLEMVQFLLEHGADPNRRGESPLIAAVAQNRPDLVGLLLDTGIDVNQWGMSGRCFSIVYTSALTLALLHGHVEVAQMLQDAGADISIVDAVMLGDGERVLSLLQQGVDVNEDCPVGRNLLILAINRGHKHLVPLLLDWGADVHFLQDEALYAAAQHDQPDTIVMLLDRGANINVNGYRTPLHEAALSGSFQAVRVLVERGADINAREAKSDYGVRSTVLMHAVEGNNIRIVHFLLKCGADVHARDARGRTALSYVKEDNADMRGLLMRFGATR